MAQGLGIKYRCLLTNIQRLKPQEWRQWFNRAVILLARRDWITRRGEISSVRFVGAAQKVSTQTSSEVRCKTLDQEPMITCRYQSRIAPSLTFRQTVTLGRAVVDGRKSATVMPRVAVPVVSTVTGSRCVPKNSGLTA